MDRIDDIKDFKKKAETAREYVDNLGAGFPQNYKEIAFKLLLERNLGLKESVRDLPEQSVKPVTLGSKTSLAGFIRKLNVRTHPDIVLAIAYYLYAQGTETFTAKDIDMAYTSAKIKKSSNTSQMIIQNLLKDYINEAGDREGKKAYILLQNGIDVIERIIKVRDSEQR